MTTTVKINASCSNTKEVHISLTTGDTGEKYILQDGESKELVVYDDREISVKEVDKA